MHQAGFLKHNWCQILWQHVKHLLLLFVAANGNKKVRQCSGRRTDKIAGLHVLTAVKFRNYGTFI